MTLIPALSSLEFAARFWVSFVTASFALPFKSSTTYNSDIAVDGLKAKRLQNIKYLVHGTKIVSVCAYPYLIFRQNLKVLTSNWFNRMTHYDHLIDTLTCFWLKCLEVNCEELNCVRPCINKIKKVLYTGILYILAHLGASKSDLV